MEYNQAVARQRRRTLGWVVKCAIGSMKRRGERERERERKTKEEERKKGGQSRDRKRSGGYKDIEETEERDEKKWSFGEKEEQDYRKDKRGT